MSPQIPIISSIGAIQLVDMAPTPPINAFEWAKLGVQFILGLIGYLHHRRLSKEQKK